MTRLLSAGDADDPSPQTQAPPTVLLDGAPPEALDPDLPVCSAVVTTLQPLLEPYAASRLMGTKCARLPRCALHGDRA